MKLPSIPKPNAGVVVGVMVGAALLGGLYYLIRKAPTNAVTSPIKKVAAITSGQG